MKGLITLVACFSSLMVMNPASAQNELHLSCRGSGTTTDIENNTVVGRDSDGGRSTGVVQTRNTRSYDGTFELQLGLGVANVRAPAGMYPNIYLSDKNEWLKVNDLDVNDREILGSFRIVLGTAPDFRIDRVTGEVSVSDMSVQFTGDCEKVDDNAAPKF